MHPTHPSAAAVAATALAGQGTAVLTSATTGAGVGVLHARTAGGAVVLLASRPDLEALGIEGACDDIAATLEVKVDAALPDLTVPRAQVVLEGWVGVLPTHRLPEALAATCAVGDVATARATWPDVRVLLLEPATAALHWPMGCAEVGVDNLAEATPDPVSLRESEVLARVDAEIGDRLVHLVRAMGHVHTAGAGAGVGAGRDLSDVREVRCVGADRHGVALRCVMGPAWAEQSALRDPHHGAHAGHDGCPATTQLSIRLAFPAPVDDAEGAVDALTLLVIGAAACPYVPGAPSSGAPPPGAPPSGAPASGTPADLS